MGTDPARSRALSSPGDLVDRVDLHAHSTASDGTASPAVLVETAARAGLAAVALTDHDTTAGWAEAEVALPPGLVLVRGVEVSAAAREDVGPPVRLHLLALLPDPTHPGLVAALEHLRASRALRGERMADALAAAGHPVTREQVREMAGGAPVGRPHVARALVAAGLVPDVEAAFTSAWLGPGGPYWVPKDDLDAEEAVALVREAGGVPVLAHGRAGARGRVVSDAAVARLVDAGLLGIEVDHPDHDARARRETAALATRHGLVRLGSSDWHGTGRPQPLGAETSGREVLEEVAALASGVPLLER